MQRNDTLIKIISAVVLIAIVFYMGYYLIDSQLNPLVTAAAMEYTIKDSAPTEGYAVRTEERLGDDTSRVSVTAEECQKLAVGSTYALKFASRESMEEADKARQLRLQIQWLEALDFDGDTAAETMAKDNIRDLAYSIDGTGFSDLKEILSDIRVTVFQNSNFTEEKIQAELESAKAQLETLENNLGTDMERLTASKSGIYSAYIDGFEDITAEQLEDIGPTELENLFSEPIETDSQNLGKLVTDISWYYAAVMDEDDTSKLEVGKSYNLEFSKTFNGTIKMKVKSIGMASDGRCVVVFVSDRNLNETIATRELTADLVFSFTTGIRIPQKAVHTDDETGQQFVYIISGVQAQRVDITILTEYDEYYLVESIGNLRDGMEVIVEADDLYSGKVVR